jgi:hypothetical protein
MGMSGLETPFLLRVENLGCELRDGRDKLSTTVEPLRR